MATYRLTFLRDAKNEWDGLGYTVRTQFEKKLAKRLSNPRVPAAKLRGLPDCYKIKLRDADYRLIYRVDDDRIVVVVIAVGIRENDEAYDLAEKRL